MPPYDYHMPEQLLDSQSSAKESDVLVLPAQEESDRPADVLAAEELDFQEIPEFETFLATHRVGTIRNWDTAWTAIIRMGNEKEWSLYQINHYGVTLHGYLARKTAVRQRTQEILKQAAV